MPPPKPGDLTSSLFDEPAAPAAGLSRSKPRDPVKGLTKRLLKKEQRAQKVTGIFRDEEEDDPGVSLFDDKFAAMDEEKGEYDGLNGFGLPETPIDWESFDENEDLEANPTSAMTPIADVTNFLFGTEMASLGMNWDGQNFSWNLENAKQQWSEEPLWSAIALGSLAFSFAAPITKSLKLGRLGMQARKGFEFSQFEGTPAGVIELTDKFNWFERFNMSTEVGRLDEVKYLASLNEGLSEARAVSLAKGNPHSFALKELRTQAWENSRRGRLSHSIARDEAYDAALMGEINKGAAEKTAQFGAGGGFDSLPKELQKQVRDEAEQVMASKGLMKAEEKMSPMDQIRTRFNRHFANGYWENTNGLTPNSLSRRQTNERIDAMADASHWDQLRQYVGQGKISLGLDTKAFSRKVYQRIFKEMHPAEDVGDIAKFSQHENAMYDLLYNLLKGQQDRAFASKFMLEGSNDVVHLNMMTRPTIKMNKTRWIPEGGTHSMNSGMADPTLFAKKGDVTELAARIKDGNLAFNDIEDIIKGGINDHMLHENYKFVRDLAIGEHGFSAAQYDKMLPEAKAAYINLDDVISNIPDQHAQAIGGRMRRMIADVDPDMIGPNGELPYITKAIAEDLTRAGGIFDNFTGASVSMMDAMTALYKTSKTAYHPATHLQNAVGNGAFLFQAGYPLASKAGATILNDAADAYKRMNKMAAKVDKDLPPGASYLDKQNEVIRRFKESGEEFIIDGESIPLAELSHHNVSPIHAESTFEAVEGGGRVADLAKGKGAGAVTARLALKYIGGAAEKIRLPASMGGKSMNDMAGKAAESYMAEDVIPKIALYMYGRSQGLPRDAAVKMVARRMPMYNTVGSAIKSGRKALFPWATFPTEALRITKNNAMDNPGQLLPWLHASSLMQAMFSSLGLGGTPEDVEEAKRGLPMWAQKPGTIITTPEGAQAGGGIMGAAAGAAAGGLMAGGKFGAAGAVVGGVIGAAVGSGAMSTLWTDLDETGAKFRGTTLDWIPSNSIGLQVKSPDFRIEGLKDIQQVIPATPLAILEPLMNIMSGRDTYGNEIKLEGPVDLASKTVAGYLGFIAPPIIQKYGFRVTTPDVGLIEAITGSDVLRELDPTNISRFLVDSGQDIDSVTGKPAGPIFSILMNNLGSWKSYPAMAETFLMNEARTEQHYNKLRNLYSRNMRYHLINGNEEASAGILRRVHNTFIMENATDTHKAQADFDEWYQKYMRDTGRSPQMRNLTMEELQEKFRLSSRLAKDSRNLFRQQFKDTLWDEWRIRQMQSESDSGNARGLIGL